jgi:hypothetical protein
MAATDIVWFGEELLLQINRQHTGRAQAQEAFATRHGEDNDAKEEANRAHKASPVRPADTASSYKRNRKRGSDGHNAFLLRWCSMRVPSATLHAMA